MVVRTDGDPKIVIKSIAAAVNSVDPDLPLAGVRTIDEIVSEAFAIDRFSVVLFSSFGVLGLLLAGVGIYGVMAFTVAQRTHEIGVRLALGARPRDVVALVVGQGMRLACLGVGLGLIGALGLTWLMKGLLFQVSSSDPLTFALIAILLSGVALFACLVPARRATRTDPMIALRYE